MHMFVGLRTYLELSVVSGWSSRSDKDGDCAMTFGAIAAPSGDAMSKINPTQVASGIALGGHPSCCRQIQVQSCTDSSTTRRIDRGSGRVFRFHILTTWIWSESTSCLQFGLCCGTQIRLSSPNTNVSFACAKHTIWPQKL